MALLRQKEEAILKNVKKSGIGKKSATEADCSGVTWEDLNAKPIGSLGTTARLDLPPLPDSLPPVLPLDSAVLPLQFTGSIDSIGVEERALSDWQKN